MIQTERLLLNRLTSGDLDAVEAIISDTSVMRWWPKRFDRDGAQRWIEKQIGRYQTDGCGYWLTRLRETGEPIGQGGVIVQVIRGDPLPGAGWIIARAHWNKGYATEMGRACIGWSFANRAEDTVAAPIQPGNVESEAVARKLGMRITTTDDFGGLPHNIWTVTRDEWPA